MDSHLMLKEAFSHPHEWKHVTAAVGLCKGVVAHLMLKEGSSESKTFN